MSDGEARAILVTISGSLHHHLTEINEAIREFRAAGAVVLSPKSGPVREEDADGFVYFDGDADNPHDVEARHLSSISRSAFLYIVNPDGYLGQSTAMEIGYALARDVPIYTSDEFSASPHKFFVEQKTVIEAMSEVSRRLEAPRLASNADLDDLQAFYSKVAQLRGFADETPVQILLLLIEEVGELAKALRGMEDLAVSASDPAPRDVALELADCLNYLLHMANRLGVNLQSAFREKERINASRTWTRPSEL